MKDLTDLFNDINNRTDEGKRFYQDLIINHEYKYALHPDIHDIEIIIDIGANIGNFSYYIYNQAKIIYAVEANLDNYNILKNYIEKYNLDKIKPFHLAIAGRNEKRKLFACTGCGGFTLEENSYFVEEVEGKTLYSFMQENNIQSADIVKMDVECAEKEICNAEDFSKAAKNVHMFIGEIHSKGGLENEMKKNGFSYTPYDQNFVSMKL